MNEKFRKLLESLEEKIIQHRLHQEDLPYIHKLAEEQGKSFIETAVGLIGESIATRQAGEHYLRLWNSLSGREQEIAALYCLGWSMPRIARELGISKSTVSVHFSHILLKMELKNSHELREVLRGWDFRKWAGKG